MPVCHANWRPASAALLNATARRREHSPIVCVDQPVPVVLKSSTWVSLLVGNNMWQVQACGPAWISACSTHVMLAWQSSACLAPRLAALWARTGAPTPQVALKPQAMVVHTCCARRAPLADSVPPTRAVVPRPCTCARAPQADAAAVAPEPAERQAALARKLACCLVRTRGPERYNTL